MITTILSDFSYVILQPKDANYTGTLNGLYKELQLTGEPFNFFDNFAFNEDLLATYISLKPKASVNIFTSGKIQNAPEVKEKITGIFDHVFSAEECGISKLDPSAYTFIAKKLDADPSHILYVDDQQINIDTALKAGFNAVLYTDYVTLSNKLNEYFS